MIPRPLRSLAVVATLAIAAACNAGTGGAPPAVATQAPCPTAQPISDSGPSCCPVMTADNPTSTAASRRWSRSGHARHG